MSDLNPFSFRMHFNGALSIGAIANRWRAVVIGSQAEIRKSLCLLSLLWNKTKSEFLFLAGELSRFKLLITDSPFEKNAVP